MGVDPAYVCILQNLYAKQSAHVRVETDSREFSLSRGVKQGDPLSSLLFISILETCMRRLTTKWKMLNSRRVKSFFGLQVKDGRSLFNLRFADDLLLFATNRLDIGKMVQHLSTEALKFGLRLHLGKTKVLTNSTATGNSKGMLVDGKVVEVLPLSGVEN